VTFEGLYDVAWTEVPMFGPKQPLSYVYYIGATALEDSIFAGVIPPSTIEASPIIATVYPNPAGDDVTFAVTVTKPSPVHVAIYDVQGRLVTELTSPEAMIGTHLIQWDIKDSNGRKVAAGIYWYAATGAESLTKGKIVITR